MNFPPCLLASNQMELLFVWNNATIEAKIIIFILLIFSIFAWSIMAAKALQMRRAARMNHFFDQELRNQKVVLSIHDRKILVEGCPNFAVYQAGCKELDGRLRSSGQIRAGQISLNRMEHVKRALERAVASEALKLESGLIMLAIAVSGAPFLGLLGTVWGVMSTFSYVAIKAAAGGQPDLATMAPGVSAALITTVAGLLVAIPSMFGYNWLVHTLRILTVGLDNFAQELVSRMEIEFLEENDSHAEPQSK